MIGLLVMLCASAAADLEVGPLVCWLLLPCSWKLSEANDTRGAVVEPSQCCVTRTGCKRRKGP